MLKALFRPHFCFHWSYMLGVLTYIYLQPKPMIRWTVYMYGVVSLTHYMVRSTVHE